MAVNFPIIIIHMQSICFVLNRNRTGVSYVFCRRQIQFHFALSIGWVIFLTMIDGSTQIAVTSIYSEILSKKILTVSSRFAMTFCSLLLFDADPALGLGRLPGTSATD